MRGGDLSVSRAFIVLFLCLSVLQSCAYFESNDIKRGDQHLAAGKWEEATVAYRQALKEAPFDVALQ
jgi:general secretion pathway protein D